MKTKSIFTLLAAVLAGTISFAQKAQNSNPYAIFGGSPYVIGAESGQEQAKPFVIENLAEGSEVAWLEHNPQTGLVKFFDAANNLIAERLVTPGERAWPTPDPKAEKYYSISPYAYCLNNPVRYIDPDGREVVGLTKDDANKALQDFQMLFADKAFDNFRNLITLDKRGKTFNTISSDAIAGAFNGIELSADQQGLVDQFVGAINSGSVHKVEYVNVDGEVSASGTNSFRSHLNSQNPGTGDMMIPANRMPGNTMNAISGGGINFPTKNGSHSVIMEGAGVTHDGGRAITTGHEIIGHGVAIANGITGVDNNTRAIRVDNLMRRVMGIPTFRNEHGGATIVNPYAMPGRLP